jgi:excisionase family DNA binding protein
VITNPVRSSAARKKTNDMHDNMTPTQVAEYLQLSTDAVYRLIRQRKLVAHKTGGTYRIPREGFETFLRATSTTPRTRKALFTRVLSIAERNPGVSSDDILNDLEVIDEERQPAQAQKG